MLCMIRWVACWLLLRFKHLGCHLIKPKNLPPKTSMVKRSFLPYPKPRNAPDSNAFESFIDIAVENIQKTTEWP